MNQNSHRNIRHISLIFLISILLSAPQLSTDGYMSVLIEDTYAFTSWAWQFTEALKDGVVYPRWMSLDFWGYGSPTFILYPPLAYYATALFEPLFSSVVKAMNFVKFLSVFATGVGIYFLTRNKFDNLIALSAAVLFISSPFYVFFIYCYGTFASICAIPLVTWIIKNLSDFYQNNKAFDLFLAGFFYGLLLMTHLITAYMLSFIILIIFIMYFKCSRPLYIPFIFAIFICSSLLTASPYIFPLFLEIGNLQLHNFVDHVSGFNYMEFFIIPIKYSITSEFWNEYNNIFRISFFIYATIFTIWLCIYYLKGGKKDFANRFSLAITIAVFFTIFSQTNLSQFFWKIIPFFDFIQFPFRWTIIMCLFVSILNANIITFLKNVIKNKFYFKLLLVIIFSLLFNIDFILINKSPIFNQASLLPANSVYWTKEHLPKGVDIDYIKQIKDDNQFLIPLLGNFEYTTKAFEAHKKEFIINSSTYSIIRIHHFYFHGWKAYLNGKEISLGKENFSNAMIITVPEGKHELRLTFENSFVKFLNIYILIFFILVFSGFYFWHRKVHL